MGHTTEECRWKKLEVQKAKKAWIERNKKHLQPRRKEWIPRQQQAHEIHKETNPGGTEEEGSLVPAATNTEIRDGVHTGKPGEICAIHEERNTFLKGICPD